MHNGEEIKHHRDLIVQSQAIIALSRELIELSMVTIRNSHETVAVSQKRLNARNDGSRAPLLHRDYTNAPPS
jgi:hypothetical protein